MKNIIPEMTNPLGQHWKQPDRNKIAIDDHHALLTKADFAMLPEYSGSIPSGVYPGKMWKRLDGLFNSAVDPRDHRWLFCWFGIGIDKGRCSINFRPVLIADADDKKAESESAGAA